MAHRYISLGSACNAAMMIKRAGLRRASYPFDWLLNVDDGLSVVNEILRDDFEMVSDPASYILVDHPPVGKVVPAYSAYPRTFHIHSDPAADPKAHAEMVRRFDRMRSTLRSKDALHFVYYRDFTAYRETIIGTSAADVVKLMDREATEFLSFVDAFHSGVKTMLLVVEASIEDRDEARSSVKGHEPSDTRITFGVALSRYDDDLDLNAQWERDWLNLLVTSTGMPLRMRVFCRLKQANRRVRNALSR